MLLILILLQTMGVLSASLPINLTSLGSSSTPAPEDLQLDPIPNPFHIPGTDIALQWVHLDHIGLPLSSDYTLNAFRKCNDRAEAHVRYIGDEPIGGLWSKRFVTIVQHVVVEFASNVPGVILYSEVSDILMAISWKMSREGFRSCWVRVWRTDVILLGELLGRVSVREGDATGV